jgi:hypothetical protein
VVYLVLAGGLTYLGAELGRRYADAKHLDVDASGSSSNDFSESWLYVYGGGLAGLILGVVISAFAEVILARRRRNSQFVAPAPA